MKYKHVKVEHIYRGIEIEWTGVQKCVWMVRYIGMSAKKAPINYYHIGFSDLYSRKNDALLHHFVRNVA